VDKAAGDIESMSINVLVDSEKVKDVAAVEGFLSGYLGPKASDTDRYKATVTSAVFDRTSEAAATKAMAESSGRQRMEQMLTLIPVVALVLVGFVVIRSMARVAKSQNVLVQALPDGSLVASSGAAFPSGVLGTGGGSPIALPAGSSLSAEQVQRIAQSRTGSSRTSLAMDDEEFEEDEYGQRKRKRRSVSFVDNEEMETIEAIREKVNVQLEQIKKMAVDRPETVAMLLKTWMLEDRK
jgi:flagellar biosynthesis/type III secretory pathway M-ring protein FliF/YscJ